MAAVGNDILNKRLDAEIARTQKVAQAVDNCIEGLQAKAASQKDELKTLFSSLLAYGAESADNFLALKGFMDQEGFYFFHGQLAVVEAQAEAVDSKDLVALLEQLIREETFRELAIIAGNKVSELIAKDSD